MLAALGIKMDREHQIISWLEQDDMRMEALRIADSLHLNDWCIAAGFVRNLIWDELHRYSSPTPLNDLDLIYFNSSRASQKIDESIEKDLKARSAFPWSVKNQARMHSRNDDEPYTSTSHAMRHWVELEIAIGARLSSRGQVELVAPFGIEALFGNTITINPGRIKPIDFKHRIESKRWLELWPNLKVANA
jgi:hypothetical protein